METAHLVGAHVTQGLPWRVGLFSCTEEFPSTCINAGVGIPTVKLQMYVYKTLVIDDGEPRLGTGPASPCEISRDESEWFLNAIHIYP